jgi:hypothetical protein
VGWVRMRLAPCTASLPADKSARHRLLASILSLSLGQYGESILLLLFQTTVTCHRLFFLLFCLRLPPSLLTAWLQVARAAQALNLNISAARGLQEVLRTNLGPRGTMKMCGFFCFDQGCVSAWSMSASATRSTCSILISAWWQMGGSALVLLLGRAACRCVVGADVGRLVSGAGDIKITKDGMVLLKEMVSRVRVCVCVCVCLCVCVCVGMFACVCLCV